MKLAMKMPLSLFAQRNNTGKLNCDKSQDPEYYLWAQTGNKSYLWSYIQRLRTEEQGRAGRLRLSYALNTKHKDN